MEFNPVFGRKIVLCPTILPMYDMYPEVWTVTDDRQPPSPGPRPRRRARKEHSVVPAILIHASPKAAEAGPAR